MATVDPDDEARRLLDQVDFVFDADMLSMMQYSDMTTPALLEQFEETKEKLLELGELLDPRTPEGIDAHGIYHGLLLELKKRKAL